MLHEPSESISKEVVTRMSSSVPDKDKAAAVVNDGEEEREEV